MMKMATGEGFPLRQGAEMGLDWLLVATEASGGGTPHLFCSPKFLGYIGIYRRKKYVRGATRGPRGWRARQGVGPLMLILSPVFFINSKNDFHGVLGLLELCRIGL